MSQDKLSDISYLSTGKWDKLDKSGTVFLQYWIRNFFLLENYTADINLNNNLRHVPPWQQNILSSMTAATGRQLNTSVNVFHILVLYLRTPEIKLKFI